MLDLLCHSPHLQRLMWRGGSAFVQALLLEAAQQAQWLRLRLL